MSWVKEFNLAILEIDNNINSFVASQKFKEMQNNFRIFIDKINTNFLPMVEKISTNLPNLVNNIITNNQKHPDR
ncbi:MAG: hypothetical protein ORN24_05515, partial [Burkholderiales bacterium]|nr:hypothetical protein [Burkholderiales bacterium]